MAEQNIKVLNSLTNTLIDSYKGYQRCCEVTTDNSHLKAEFARRKTERMQLTAEFKAQVRRFGATPEESGSLAGAVHRGFTRFTALFQDDLKAAVSALDDGEAFLVEKIEDKLEITDLAPETIALLQRAHASALSGERMADTLDA